MDLLHTSVQDRFPIRVFLVYVIFYAGQAMYNTYLNLYLNDSGFNMTAIGGVQSAATLALVLIQPLWGVLSDKAKSKNRIIALLAIITTGVCLCFYASKAALWLAFCVMLFTVFFNPMLTLQDNYALEYLEGSKWDFGHIRLGGTLGYAVCAMLVGFIIGNNYGQIFWIMSIFFLAVCICYLTLPQVEGHRQKHEKVKYSVLLKDKPLRWMLVFNVIYYLGTAFYFQFYPLYFRNELGASTQLVGMLTFCSAMSEVPFFWFAHKLEKKFGVKRVMLFAGSATALRWFLLFFVSNPVAVLFINMLSGCGYVGFSYCLIKYINDTVPKSMRATAQSLNAILGTIFSKILFAPLGGVLSDLFGIRQMLLVAGIILVCGIIGFAAFFKPPQRT